MTLPSLAIPEANSKAPATSVPSARARERQGRIMIVIGSLVALLGVVAYCVSMLIGELSQEPPRFWTEELIVIGAGLAVWLHGTVVYLNALMDLGGSDDSF